MPARARRPKTGRSSRSTSSRKRTQCQILRLGTSEIKRIIWNFTLRTSALLARNQKNKLDFHAAKEADDNDFFFDVHGVPDVIELSDDDDDDDDGDVNDWTAVSAAMAKLLRYTYRCQWTPLHKVAI